ncbi:hypothetical protein [Antarctobacter heliothermus]|uniref:Uncharacterized protein n=1 Tax=Antarctobacter heliothermus TaxID=74033 RepID=A0A239JS40_9RHOB|nr:hypothetical protein [Antarctobacter heliothermus]SNT07594.1 hypothetical protein SAMN04488078_10558 [Antarctobacter heliothermus]
MSPSVRPAVMADLDILTDLLMRDAEQRQIADPDLWTLRADARAQTAAAVKRAMENENPPFRQQWLLAEAGGAVVGVIHTILLPVPPIYAGEFGAPGLIMEDSYVSDSAPDDTRAILFAAAEADLIEAGAKVLVASSIVDGAWTRVQTDRNYVPLTLYLARTGLRAQTGAASVRKATEADVPAIVGLSAEHRQILMDLNVFWKPHPDADVRFGSWMARSLTLPDRDMFVADPEGEIEGYAISQPATALHFPPAHDIAATGFIDDFHHADLQDPDRIEGSGKGALDLFAMAEAALAQRGNDAALVVCPAAWGAKKALLEAAGYETALVWRIKR